jgi:hypothetical protein
LISITPWLGGLQRWYNPTAPARQRGVALPTTVRHERKGVRKDRRSA